MPAVKRTSPVWPQGDCARTSLAAGLRVLASGLFLRTRQQLDNRIDRVCLREIGSTLESRLDQAADDLRAADCLAMLQTNVDGQTIEISDMTVEQHDRDLGPGLGMDDGTTAIALCLSHTYSCISEFWTGTSFSVLPSPTRVYLSVSAERRLISWR